MLVLVEGGEVYSFGSGHYGQPGHGDWESQSLPKLIVALRGKRVVQVSAAGVGVAHSLALLTGGGVYSLGCGRSGQLGHDDKQYNRMAVVAKGDSGAAGQALVGGRTPFCI